MFVDLPSASIDTMNMTFHNVTAPYSDIAIYRCPCCHCRTLHERGGYEICPICFWEGDGQDNHDAAEVRGGPNRLLSLIEARRNFEAFGASERAWLDHVRLPTDEER